MSASMANASSTSTACGLAAVCIESPSMTAMTRLTSVRRRRASLPSPSSSAVTRNVLSRAMS